MQRKIFLIVVSLLSTIVSYGQFTYGTTGLLHMPTADMQRDKTVMIGGSFLNINATPKHFDYDTGNYYLNVTIMPWLEIGYTLTLHYAHHGSTYFPQKVWGKYANQDRMFSIRIRALKEGVLNEWTPQVVIGVNDPASHVHYGGGEVVFDNSGASNAYFTRYFIAATKHLEFEHLGVAGAHLSLIYSQGRGTKEHFHRPAIGADFKFSLDEVWVLPKIVNRLKLMAEYDSENVNIGAKYRIYKDNINVVCEMLRCKYFSGGIYFKLHLK